MLFSYGKIARDATIYLNGAQMNKRKRVNFSNKYVTRTASKNIKRAVDAKH